MPIVKRFVARINPRDHFKLIGVTAADGFRLTLEYADGFTGDVDLSAWIEETPCLAKLKTPATFRKARVGAGGWSVDWDQSGNLSFGSDNLRNLAYEQAGMIGHEIFQDGKARSSTTTFDPKPEGQELGFEYDQAHTRERHEDGEKSGREAGRESDVYE